MSYNSTPEWTADITIPHEDNMRCPTCNQVAFNVKEVMSDILKPSYYNPRHIPPKLFFTCANENCPDCDKDFYVGLAVIIRITETKGMK